MSLDEALSGTAVEAAPRLLGRVVSTEIDGERVAVVLTEVEAYEGGDDPASHAFRGPTPRNGAMFGPAGTLYVYRSYGIHWCMNVTVGEAGAARAVLMRGARIIAGEAVIRRRRERRDHLVDGPGKLCQALGVTGEMDGTDVRTGPVRVSAEPATEGRVIATPRIGITKAVDRPWRFVLVDGVFRG